MNPTALSTTRCGASSPKRRFCRAPWSCAALVVCLLMLAPSLAQAGGCGSRRGGGSSVGGGSSGGGSSSCQSSDGDGGSSSYSSAVPEKPRCIEVSSVLGLKKCGRDDQRWDQARSIPVFFTMGMNARSTVIAHYGFEGVSIHDDVDYAYALNRAHFANQRAMLMTMEMMLSAFLFDHVHVGGYLSLGLGKPFDLREVKPSAMALEVGGMRSVGLGAVAGVSLPVGVVALNFDLIVGWRGNNVDVTTRVGDCVIEESLGDSTGLAEVRLGIDVWVQPWLSLNMYAGSDLVDLGSFYGGLAVKFHSDSYYPQ